MNAYGAMLTGTFNSFMLLMLYLLVPWTAANLVDFYFVRDRRYAMAEILQPDGLYRPRAWHGVHSRNLNHAAEAETRQASEAELEGSTA